MRKLIITEWVSLDGIFDSSSMEQWFNPFHSDNRANYIQDTLNNCEIMLYGRKTYEMLFPYWSAFTTNEMGVADKLNKGKKYVVSSKLKEANWENTAIIRENFIEAVVKLKKQDGGYILVQGSSTLIKPLIEAGLVDELKLLVNPYLMGKGNRPFLTEINCKLEFLNFQQFDNGVIVLSYKPTTK
jgi:dihydrofolate reductase